MNATQEAKLNMFRATQKHCNDNPTILRLGTFFLRRVSAQDFVSWLAGLALASVRVFTNRKFKQKKVVREDTNHGRE